MGAYRSGDAQRAMMMRYELEQQRMGGQQGGNPFMFGGYQSQAELAADLQLEQQDYMKQDWRDRTSMMWRSAGPPGSTDPTSVRRRMMAEHMELQGPYGMNQAPHASSLPQMGGPYQGGASSPAATMGAWQGGLSTIDKLRALMGGYRN